MNNKEIYSLWINGNLWDVHKLCVKSVQNFGHKLIIYSFDKNITTECEVRDAREIMDEKEIYYYKNMMGGNPNFKFGGIAEKLKAKMLGSLGGVHIDLDVVFLKEFDYAQEYVFRPHNLGIVGNVIKAPVWSELSQLYYRWTEKINENNTDWEKSFKGLNQFVKDLNLEQYIAPVEELGKDISEYWWDFIHTDKIPDEKLKLIHFCGAMDEFKNAKENSYYKKLLKKYDIK
jgi:hypothetical protein